MAKESLANNPTNDDTEEMEGLQVVAFKLRDEEYGVNIFQVQEIRNLVDITRVPFSASYIQGVINLRGSVLPVIDLKKRLGLEQTPYTDDTRIVTVMVGEFDELFLAVPKEITKTRRSEKSGRQNRYQQILERHRQYRRATRDYAQSRRNRRIALMQHSHRISTIT